MGFVIYPQMTQIIADDLLPVMPGLTPAQLHTGAGPASSKIMCRLKGDTLSHWIPACAGMTNKIIINFGVRVKILATLTLTPCIRINIGLYEPCLLLSGLI